MNKLDLHFSKLLNIILKFTLGLILVVSVGTLFSTLIGFNIGTIIFTAVISISLFISYKLINSNLTPKKKLLSLLFLATVIRVLWLLNSNSVPTSDFKTMYESATAFLNGDLSAFKGLGYIARFPHLTITTLYMALIQYLFPVSNLLVMKLINLSLSIVDLVIIFFIVKKLFSNSKYALYTVALCTVFPPFITYTSVFCSENLAIPFYLLSILLFIRILEYKNTVLLLILSSICLSIGNLFRMIATVILIAYILYVIIYTKDNLFKKALNTVALIIPYFLILILISGCLEKMDILESPLWNGREPNITSVLKGTNIESLGRWNQTDADFIEENLSNYDTLKERCNDEIINRLTSTNPLRLTAFYIEKLSFQWSIGDFAGSFWSQNELLESEVIFKIGTTGSLPFQLIYTVMLFFIFINLFTKIKDNPQINLFYLILCGYIAAYLLIENQSRYAYIVSWVFPILFAYSFRCSSKIKKLLKL